MPNVMRSTMAFPGILANFGKRENAERETSAHFFTNRDVVVSTLGTGVLCPGVYSSLWLNLLLRRDICLERFTVAQHHCGTGWLESMDYY